MPIFSYACYELEWVGEQSWIITPTEQALLPIFSEKLHTSRLPYLENITSCFKHVLLEFSCAYRPLDVPENCRHLFSQIAKTAEVDCVAKTHQLPIDFSKGVDLEDLASTCQLSLAQLKEQLLSLELQVMVNGFAPGFSYCGELPKALQVTRRPTPRVHIPAGSVAIADKYLAIYPQVSPGGWHIIGHCSQCLFNVNAAPPNTLNVGDKVTFFSTKKA